MEKLSYLCTLNSKVENCFVISLTSLQHGSYVQQWNAGNKFFEEFGSNDVRSADIMIDAAAVKTGGIIKVDLKIRGKVVVPCDRCLEDLEIPVNVSAALIAGAVDNNPDEREEVEISDGDLVLDQVVFDYVITSIPIVKTHPEGECSAQVKAFLEQKSSETGNNPFAGLKDILK